MGTTASRFERIQNYSLFALAFFPLTDFVLRELPGKLALLGAVWDKLILIFLAAWAVKAYLEGTRIEQEPYHKILKLFLALGVVYVFINLSDFSIGFEGFRAVYLYSLYAFILPLVVKQETAMKLIRASLYCLLLISLYGIYQFIVKTHIPSNWVDAAETVRTRVFTVFGSPNIMGSYTVLMFPIAAGMALTVRSTKGRFFYAFIAAITAASLAFTYTRGAWMALLVALLVVSALLDKRLLILILVACGAAMLLHPIRQRVTELFTPLYWMKASSDGRIYRWLTTYDIIRENPLFGHGLGHYGGAVAARHYDTIYVDNYYAKTMAEMGLLGLGMMLTLFVTLLRNLYSRIFKPLRSRSYWPLLIGMYTGVLGVLVHNAVENVFEVPAMNFLFWFFVSMIVILTRSVYADHSNNTSNTPAKIDKGGESV